MKWIWLFGSVILEVIGTSFLKLSSEGGKHALLFGIGVVVFYVACFAFLGMAMKHFALGTIYAIWSGLGICLLAVVGIVFFGDEVNSLKLVSFVLIVAGVIGLNLGGVSH